MRSVTTVSTLTLTLTTAQLSAGQPELTRIVTLAQLLRYDEVATFTKPQEFGGEVTAAGTLGR